MLDEVGDQTDHRRFHLTGPIEHDQIVDLLSLSWAHVYLTYPFVLSWSLLEAMACECAIVASDMPPVRDAIEDGVTGLLVDFFDAGQLATTIGRAIEDQAALMPMRTAAREAVLQR